MIREVGSAGQGSTIIVRRTTGNGSRRLSRTSKKGNKIEAFFLRQKNLTYLVQLLNLLLHLIPSFFSYCILYHFQDIDEDDYDDNDRELHHCETHHLNMKNMKNMSNMSDDGDVDDDDDDVNDDDDDVYRHLLHCRVIQFDQNAFLKRNFVGYFFPFQQLILSRLEVTKIEK